MLPGQRLPAVQFRYGNGPGKGGMLCVQFLYACFRCIGQRQPRLNGPHDIVGRLFIVCQLSF